MGTMLRCLFMATLLGVAWNAHAMTYYLDSYFDTARPHYRSPEEACIAGELMRRTQGYQEGDNRRYRYTGAYVGPDQGIGEWVCRGAIERQYYYSGASWVTVEVVDTLVYSVGSQDSCVLPNFRDPETGQCGPPKCTNSCCDSGCGNGTNPIQTASGNKHQVEADFTGSGSYSLNFSRTYDSKRTWLNNSAPIGVGWIHSYLAHVVIMPVQGGSTVNRAVVYRPDGRILRFNLSGSTWASDADVSERLSVVLDGSGNYLSATFTTNNDEVESYDALGRLTSITNRNGLTQTVTYTTGPLNSASTISHNYVQSVSDPSGHALTFAYSGGRLTTVSDGNGSSIQYTYDSSGNLQTVVYPDITGSKTRTYLYNETGQTGGVSQPNALTGIQDENSQRFASWGYNAAGFGNLSVHGPFTGGTIDRTTLTFNADGTTTVIDSLGKTRKFTFQVNYLVARYTALDQPCDYCGTQFNSRTYDGNGYPSSSKDFNNNQTQFTYNARGLEAQRIEASGAGAQRTVNTTWNSTFRVPDQRSLVNANSITESLTKWVYNARGQVRSRCEIDPAVSGASSYTCGSLTNAPLGVRQTTYTYCEQAGVTAGTCPLIGLMLTVDGPRTDVSDVTTYSYYQTTDLSGCATLGSTCHSLGDLYQVTNAMAQTVTYVSYDKNGRVTRQKDPNGTLTDFTYHPRGWLLTRTVRANANGSSSSNDATTTFAYDGVGNVTRITQPDQTYLHYVYDTAHRLTDIYDSATPSNYLNGNRVHYTLDAAGNRTKEETKDSSGTLTRSLSRQYDQLNRLTQVLNAANATVQTYQNPPAPEVPPTGVTYTNGYDGNGNAIYSVDGNGVGTERQYDPLNRLAKSLQDHAGTGATKDTTTQYAYDARDNVRSVTDPDSLVTNYTYDGLNNLAQLQSPDTGTSGYTYDAAGNRVTQTDAKGVQSTYTYDALNRLTGVIYSNSSLNVTYRYDEPDNVTGCGGSSSVGRLTTMLDSGGSTTYCYDRRGNLTQVAQTVSGILSTTNYTYTLADRLRSVLYPSGITIQYDRDTVGRITALSIVDTSTTLVSTVTYAPFGPVKQITFGNGRTLGKTYDQDYAISQVASSDPNGLALQAGVDVLGNLISATGGLVARNYQYDPLYRLIQVQNGSASTLEAFSYNKTGDRLSKTRSGGTDTYVYASPLTSHRLLNVAGTARTYDANGNTSQIGLDTFTYDDRNRLVQAGNYSYDYNGKGERVLKYVESTTPVGQSVSSKLPGTLSTTGTSVFSRKWTTFTYSQDGKLLTEVLTTKSCQGIDRFTCSPWIEFTTETDYLWLDNTLVGLLRDGDLYYVETDQLGTPRRAIAPGATTATDTVIWSWDYFGSSFGEHAPNEDPSASGTTFTVNLRYPGQYYDAELGTNYNYLRDCYDPATGRYCESDPLGLRGGINTYAYVGSNPLTAIDPSGLTQCDIDTAFAVAKDFYPTFNMGEGPPVVDLPRDYLNAGESQLRNQGDSTSIPGRDGLIHLKVKFLDCLSDDDALYLLKSVLHEILHFTRPYKLQGPPEFDHGYIRPESEKMTSALRIPFLKAREKCKCCKQ